MRVLTRVTPAVVLLTSALFLAGCKSVEERAEDHYQSAIALIEEGDASRAIVELRNVFELVAGHEGAHRTMAELMLEQGNTRRAYGHYLHLAESNPDDLDSRIILSEMAFSIGNWEELDRHGARAAELDPENARVKAITLIRDYRTAIADEDESARREIGRQADAMLADQPESTLLRNIMIDTTIREQEFTRALSEIEWMIDKEPENTRYYQERLRVLAILGDMSAIEEQLREMIEIFPEETAHKATLLRFLVGRNQLDTAETFLRDLAAASEPDDPAPTVDLLRFLVEYRDADTVRAEIDKAIAERPDPIPFRIIEARYDFTQGNRAEGIKKLQDVLAAEEPLENERDVKITLAKMLLNTGNEVGARTHVEEVLAEESTHPEALKMQAAWQTEADDTDAALAGLRIALDQVPDDAEAMTLTASAYARAGQNELAKDFLAQAVEASGNAPAETLRYAQLLIEEERYLPAEDILLAALRINPSNTNILFALGRLYLQMEDFGRVGSVVDTLRRNGSEAAIRAANGIEAERLNRQRGVGEAMSFLEDLAGGADATLASKVALIRARIGTGDVEGALTLTQELKADNPDSETIDAMLAVVQIANGNLEEAETIYRDLVASNPNRQRIWRSLAGLQIRKGDRDGAKALIDEGLGHMPKSPDLLWAKASFHEQDGEIDAAIEIYEQLYEENSRSVIVANNLASLLATHRDDEASLERAWTVARRLRDADNPALKDTYGWITHRRGDSAEALPYLEAAAQGLPRDPIVQYHLGQILVALDRPEDALEQFRKAIELAGETDTRPQIETARGLVQSLQNAETTDN